MDGGLSPQPPPRGYPALPQGEGLCGWGVQWVGLLRAGWGWAGWLAVGGGADGGEDGGEVVEDGVVGEAQGAVADGGQEGVAIGIGVALGAVDVTVELDDEAAIGAAEIDDEGPDGMLTAELEPVEAAMAEGGPEELLGGGLAGSQGAGGWHVVAAPGAIMGHGGSFAENDPHPNPPPRGCPARRSQERGFACVQRGRGIVEWA